MALLIIVSARRILDLEFQEWYDLKHRNKLHLPWSSSSCGKCIRIDDLNFSPDYSANSLKQHLRDISEGNMGGQEVFRGGKNTMLSINARQQLFWSVKELNKFLILDSPAVDSSPHFTCTRSQINIAAPLCWFTS